MPATMINRQVDSTRKNDEQRQQRELPDAIASRNQSTALRRETKPDRTAKRRSKRDTRPTNTPMRVDPQHTAEPQPHTPPKKAEAQRQSTGWMGSFIDTQPLEKSFVMFGFVVAITLLAIYGSDLAIGWPFQHASTVFDITNVICGLGLAYVSWDAYRDLL